MGALPLENIKLLKAIPFQVGDFKLFAVKVEILPIKADEKPGLNFLVVDASGRYVMNGLMDLVTGDGVDFEPMSQARFENLSPDFGRTVLTGSGKLNLVFVSDPFCPHCKRAYSFLKQKMDDIKDLKMVQYPLSGNLGSEIAAAVLIYCLENNISPHEVLDFAFTKMKSVNPEGENEALVRHMKTKTLEQFLNEFPKLKEKLGEDLDKAVEKLENEVMSLVKADKEKAMEMGIHSTPVIFVEGIRLSGFNAKTLMATMEKVLEEKKDAGKK